MNRGIAAALMMMACSATGAMAQQKAFRPVDVQSGIRTETSYGDAMNIEIAHVVGRAGVRHVETPLTRQELLSIMVLMSAQREAARTRS